MDTNPYLFPDRRYFRSGTLSGEEVRRRWTEEFPKMSSGRGVVMKLLAQFTQHPKAEIIRPQFWKHLKLKFDYEIHPDTPHLITTSFSLHTLLRSELIREFGILEHKCFVNVETVILHGRPKTKPITDEIVRKMNDDYLDRFNDHRDNERVFFMFMVLETLLQIPTLTFVNASEENGQYVIVLAEPDDSSEDRYTQVTFTVDYLPILLDCEALDYYETKIE